MNKGERLNQDQLVKMLLFFFWLQILCLLFLIRKLTLWFLMFPVKLGSVLLFQDAVSKYQEVTNNLEFAKELQRSFMALSQDVSRRQYIYL